MDDMLKDPRFSHIARDPKFRRIPKSERKVKIDKRFKVMFTDKNFLVHHTIDKRGRPMNTTSAVDLKKFYDQSSSDEENEKEKKEEEEEEENETDQEEEAVKKDEKVTKKPEKSPKPSTKKVEKIETKKQKEKKSKNGKLLSKNKKNDAEKSDDSSNSLEEVDEELTNNEAQLNLKIKREDKKVDADTKKKLKDLACDYARGEGVLFSDSSSSDESSEEEDTDKEEELDHHWGELDKDAETTEEITSRLAACNMEWDKIRAVDLFVLFNSFLQAGGLIHSVTIYPSEYGLKRLQEEDLHGPIELVDSFKQKDYDEESDNNDNEEGSSYTMEKMRQYKLNTLKYYYAVIKFDSPTTANKVYTECDGMEYQKSSTKLDLRFIPEDMEFEHEPKEVCDELPDPSKYQPRLYETKALQQAKVDLTWDETKPERQEITQKINSGKIDDINDHDLQAYLAPGTSDEESDGEQEEKKEESDSDNDENNKKSRLDKYKLLLQSIEEKEVEKKNKDIGLEFTWGLGKKEKAEKLVKERMKKGEELTPFEQFLEKRKEKKRLKREEKQKKKQTGDDESDSEDSIPSDVDMNDPFFADEMKNRKTKKVNKKNKNHSDDDDDVDEEEAQRKAELELLLLDREDEQNKQHFNMKQIEENEGLTKSKKKRLIKKQKNKKTTIEEDNFQVDVNDSRFAALYNSHHFNIDPADPHYRKTKGSEALISEKLKRRAQGDTLSDVPKKIPKQSKETKMKIELAALVKSVKRNTKNNMSQKVK